MGKCQYQCTTCTSITDKSCPPCIAPFVTVTSHVITGSTVSTMSYTLLTTIQTIGPLCTFCNTEQNVTLLFKILLSQNVKMKQKDFFDNNLNKRHTNIDGHMSTIHVPNVKLSTDNARSTAIGYPNVFSLFSLTVKTHII